MTEALTLAKISAEAINTNFDSIENAVNSKADLNGDSTKTFDVADAVESTDAINKGQLETAVSTVNSAITNLNTEMDTKLATKLDVSDTTVTKQGNTFNGNSQLVQTNASGQLPALDGSLLTGISSGALTINALGSTSSNITLPANQVTTAAFAGAPTISLPTVSDSTIETTVILDFTTASISSPILPTGLKWSDKNKGFAPSAYSTLSGVRNVLTFKTRDLGVTWEAEYTTYGGTETAWVQPILTADGTLGGNSFAVYSNNVLAIGYEAYRGMDGNANSFFSSSGTNFSYIWYNPIALKVSQIVLGISGNSIGTPSNGTLYGSNDNATWTNLNNNVAINTPITYATTITVIPENQDYYKYYKFVTTCDYGGANAEIREVNFTATYIAT